MNLPGSHSIYEPYPAKSRVAFFGDSLTRLGGCMLRVAAQYRALFPERDVRFFNVGISGGGLAAANLYLDAWLAPIRPTHVVLAFGVNDAHALRVDPAAPDAVAEADRVDNASTAFRDGYLALTGRIEALGAKVAVRTITPYDETVRADGASAPVPGNGDAFRRVAAAIRSVAASHGLPCLDDFARMSARLSEGASLFRQDRVHPTDLGHWCLAETLLEAQGLPVPEYTPQDEVIAESGLGDWFNLAQRVANILSSEWHFVRDETLDISAKLAKVRAWLDANGGKTDEAPPLPFLIRLAEDYLRDKPQEATLRAAVDASGSSQGES